MIDIPWDYGWKWNNEEVIIYLLDDQVDLIIANIGCPFLLTQLIISSHLWIQQSIALRVSMIYHESTIAELVTIQSPDVCTELTP